MTTGRTDAVHDKGIVMHPRFRLASAVVALMAAVLVAAPVTAASPWQTSTQSGTNAYAFTGGACTDNPDGTATCSGTLIDVFKGTIKETGAPTRKAEQACYSEFTYTLDAKTGDISDSHSLFGCTFDARTLAINDLTSITLVPTVISLTAIACDASGACTESPAGSMTASGAWIGIGPIVAEKGKFKYDDGTCVQVNADKGGSRRASFDGSINSTDAEMSVGSFTFRTNCPF